MEHLLLGQTEPGGPYITHFRCPACNETSLPEEFGQHEPLVCGYCDTRTALDAIYSDEEH